MPCDALCSFRLDGGHVLFLAIVEKGLQHAFADICRHLGIACNSK